MVALPTGGGAYAARVAGGASWRPAMTATRRVAAELGSKPMSLYRYIGSKDELVTLMVDAAAQPLASGPEGESWREGLTRWCWGYRDLLQRHPWILRVPISGPPLTPNQLFFLERGLQALGGTTLLENEKMSVMLLLSGFVRNEATLMADIAAAAEETGSDAREIMPSYGKLVGRLIDPERFPALQQVLDARVFDQDDEEDDEFIFGLERILDGVELLMQARS